MHAKLMRASRARMRLNKGRAIIRRHRLVIGQCVHRAVLMRFTDAPRNDALIGPDTAVYDLGDRTVSPGFSDVHCFFTGYSVGFVGADLSACASEAELVEAALAYAATIPAEKSVLCHGWNAEAVPVNGTAALDAAFGNRPAILFAAGCETCWMNQAALNKYQFTPETCYPEA